MKTVAIIQARMGSTRFPGKVLATLGHARVLLWSIAAAQRAFGVDEAVVATSTLEADDEIYNWCTKHHVHCVRGSETDVLSRYVEAADASSADIVLRLTADCPFLDPDVIAQVIKLRQLTGAEYATNTDPPTWPDGLDVEVFTVDTLKQAHKEAVRPTDRDCVTRWIVRNKARFKCENLVCPLPGLHKERWVLDTTDDYKFCQEIALRLSEWPTRYLEILTILEMEPNLRSINPSPRRNERYYDAISSEPIQPFSYTRSNYLYDWSETNIPLGAQTFSKSKLQFPRQAPLFVTYGDGGYVYDADGNEFVDLVSALLPNVLGYRDPDVDAAIRRQLNNGISFSLSTSLESDLAERLVHHVPCAEMVRYGKNGSDVTTAAVRLARAYTGRDKILICGGYHGWHDWAIDNTIRDLGTFDCNDVTRVPFGNDQKVFNYIHGRAYAAVIVEPETNRDYLMELRDLCDDTGTLLIFDEIITGFRFHIGGAQVLWGVKPDLACFGKAMANGMPLSAIVGRDDIMERMQPPDNIFFSGTFFGETLSLAAAIATIDKIERENIIQHLYTLGTELISAVTSLIAQHELGGIVELYGHPALPRIRFNGQDGASAAQLETLFRQTMIRSGVLIIASNNFCFAHKQPELKRILNAYNETFSVMSNAISSGRVAAAIDGESVTPTVRQA